MRRFKRLISSLILVIIFVSSMVLTAEGAMNCNFNLYVNGYQDVQIGIDDYAEVSMVIETKDEYEFYSMQDYIKFDPEYFELDTSSIRVKTVTKSGAEVALMNYSPMENGGKYDRVFVNRASVTAEKFGISEEIISFKLKPVKKGTTEITHYRTEMLGVAGERYEINETNAVVNIGDKGTTEITTETTTEVTTASEETETTTIENTETTTAANSNPGRGGGSSSSVTAYTVTYVVLGEKTTEKVNANRTVKKPENPSVEGYMFEGWYTDMAYISEYDFSAKVTGNLTLYAKMTAGGDEEQKEVESLYNDVEKEAWYKEAIDYVTKKGIMVGISENEFAPEVPVTRGMFVTVIHRIEGTPGASEKSTFEDVKRNSWYAEAVDWANENNIVYGYSDKEYGPDDIITREQMAAIIYRYAEYKGINSSVENGEKYKVYSDYENISEYAKNAVSWVSEKGLMSGDEGGTFRPTDKATRAETAQMIMNVIENLGNINRA